MWWRTGFSLSIFFQFSNEVENRKQWKMNKAKTAVYLIRFFWLEMVFQVSFGPGCSHSLNLHTWSVLARHWISWVGLHEGCFEEAGVSIHLAIAWGPAFLEPRARGVPSLFGNDMRNSKIRGDLRDRDHVGGPLRIWYATQRGPGPHQRIYWNKPHNWVFNYAHLQRLP